MSKFSPFFQEESQAIRDERKDHGAWDESSSEQQVRELADYTLTVRKNWSPRPSATGSYRREGGRKGGSETKYGLILKVFKILENLNYSMFCLNNGGTVLL